MSTEILYIIIAILFGIITGGAGGTALVKRTFKVPAITDEGSGIATTAAVAAASAATTVFRSELSNHMTTLEKNTENVAERLRALETTIASFEGSCIERHKGVDRRLEKLEEKIL